TAISLLGLLRGKRGRVSFSAFKEMANIGKELPSESNIGVEID
ncbi:MAG: hypothetical protein ACI8XV_001257, partial [Arenicella sp.]